MFVVDQSHAVPLYDQMSAEMVKPFAALCAGCKRIRSAMGRSLFGSRIRAAPPSAAAEDDDASTAPFAAEGPSRAGSIMSDYTELHRGSVPCPSCKGTGLIPKELESTLVALIPVNDERLKPKKTCLIVLGWVLLCAFIGLSLLFLLMPRTVMLSTDRAPIEVVNVTDHNESLSFINFNFFNRVNVTSGNYIPVDLTSINVTIVSKFQPWSTDIVGHGNNATISDRTPLVLYRTTRGVTFNNTVLLKDVVADYCQASYSHLTALYVTLKFDITASLRYYYGHEEQVMLSVEQQVCCVPSGNCTAPNYWPPFISSGRRRL